MCSVIDWFRVNTVVKLLKYITVEPVLFLSILGLSMQLILSDTVTYQAICYQNYDKEICNNLKNYTKQQNFVQDKSVQWKMYKQVAYFVPAIFMDALLGAWGDKNGRQINMLWGFIGGIVFSYFPVIALATLPQLPVILTVITAFFAGCTGSMVIVFMSCNAYVADVTNDASLLSIRMTVLQCIMGLGGIFGQLGTGFLTSHVTLSLTTVVGQGMLVLGFTYALLFIKQIPPNELKNSSKSKVINPSLSSEEENYNEIAPGTTADVIVSSAEHDKESIIHFLSHTYHEACCLLKDCWFTFTKPRFGNSRGIIWTVLIFDVLYSLATMGSFAILPLYAFAAPLNWSPSTLSYWMAFDATVGAGGALLGILVFKKLFKLRDTTVIILALVATAGNRFIIGFAKNLHTMCISSAIGALANVVQPCIKSFATQLIEPDETGKVFTGFMVTQEISLLCAAMIFNNLFPVFKTVFPGFIFVFCGILLVLCVFLFTVVHLIRIRDERSIDLHQL